ncbi:MAG: hypothetical protein OXN94_04165 [Chloroflexota bacterium]|nr:hypothetical protein [Chloroflexota bacterium]
MRDLIFTGIVDRLLFTAIVLGILMAVAGGWTYFDLANQLSSNQAAQIHEEGGEVAIESKNQARGLMASDIERRRLMADQRNMMVVGGAGLALIGLGWFLGDILRGRRRTDTKKDTIQTTTKTES